MRARALAFCLLAALATSCSTLPRTVTPPAVELGSLRVADPTLTAATLVFGLRVDNPNGFGLEVDRLSYKLDLNQKELAVGRIERAARVGARARTTVEIPVRVGYVALFRSLKDMMLSRKVDYVLSGVVAVGGSEVPFSFDGKALMPFLEAMGE